MPVGGTIALRNLFFAVMLLCFVVLQRDRWRHIDFLLWRQWAVYAAVIALALGYAIDITYSLGEMRAEFLYPLLLFWLGLNLVRNESDYFRFIAILAIGNLFLVTYSLAITALGLTTKDGLVGTINTGVGTYSTYLVTVIPLIALFSRHCLTSRQRQLSLVLSLLALAGLTSLYFTQNRQGVLVLIVEIGVVVALMRVSGKTSLSKSWPLAVALLLATVAFLMVSAQRAPAPEISAIVGMDSVGQSVKTDVRWRLWQFSLEEIGKSPMTGGGFGQRVFKLRFPDFEPNSMLWHAHNMVLNKGVQMGIPGMLAFLVLFFSVPWALREGLNSNPASRQIAAVGIAIALGVFLKNMTDDFFTRDCGYLYWIIIGATLGCIRGTTTNNKESA
ncbi:O-antigen ligase family protein [Propionivibrio sp.]|uniref:O-antigen ligase family protein n=1 Tax=Propionivibrio sp. TaxID=2212460 RepID=UPI003BF2FC88